MANEPVSDEFLRQLGDIANGLMDGVEYSIADRGIAGAMLRVALDELHERRLELDRMRPVYEAAKGAENALAEAVAAAVISEHEAE